MTRDAQLWAAVLAAGPGAQLSHETAAEINRLTDRQSPFIHVTIPANRRITPPKGVIIHLSSTLTFGWRFARGIPPHTFAEETVVDLVHAATDLNDVIAWVTGGFGKGKVSEGRLREVAAARKRLRWRGDLDEIIRAGAGGAHSVIEYRYDHDVEQAHGLPTAAKQVKYTKPDGSRGYRDRYYEKYKLIVELDGKQYHPLEHRGRDQDRDNDAAATVGSTLRYGWVDVTSKRCDSARQVHAALTRRRLHRTPQTVLADLRSHHRLRQAGESVQAPGDELRQQRRQDGIGVGEVGQHRVRPGGGQLAGRVTAGRHADRPRPGGQRRLDVERRVPDHHRRPAVEFGGRLPVHRRRAPPRDRDQLGPYLVVVAVGADAQVEAVRAAPRRRA